MSTGYEVKISFVIANHSKDLILLDKIKDYFGGVGSICKGTKTIHQYRVSSLKELRVIINHLDKYPLLTKNVQIIGFLNLQLNYVIERRSSLTK